MKLTPEQQQFLLHNPHAQKLTAGFSRKYGPIAALAYLQALMREPIDAHTTHAPTVTPELPALSKKKRILEVLKGQPRTRAEIQGLTGLAYTSLAEYLGEYVKAGLVKAERGAPNGHSLYWLAGDKLELDPQILAFLICGTAKAEAFTTVLEFPGQQLQWYWKHLSSVSSKRSFLARGNTREHLKQLCDSGLIGLEEGGRYYPKVGQAEYSHLGQVQQEAVSA